MNKISRHCVTLLFISLLVMTLPVHEASAQTPDSKDATSTSREAVPTPSHALSLANQMDALKTRRYSCNLNKRPDTQYKTVYAITSDTSVSRLTSIHAPAVFAAGNQVFVSDAFSLFQFDHANKPTPSIVYPQYASDTIPLAITEQTIIQKQRVKNDFCVTVAPITAPTDQSNIYCKNSYYKAYYHEGAVYILENAPCTNTDSRKSCKGASIHLAKYALDGTLDWNNTFDQMPASNIVGAWNNILLILTSSGSLVAVDTKTGSEIYRKEYIQELALENDYMQFNHFYVDRTSGLWIAASRYHNKIAVIDIFTGSIIKKHDFGKAFAHDKFLEEDYHYIMLGDYEFPLNTIMGIDNGIMYVRKGKNILTAIELKTGKQIWKYNIDQSLLNDDPIFNSNNISYHVGDILITDDLVLIGYQKYVTALNKKTGNLVWNYRFFPFYGHFGYQMWLSCIHDHFIIQSDNLYLYPKSPSIFDNITPFLIFVQNQLNSNHKK